MGRPTSYEVWVDVVSTLQIEHPGIVVAQEQIVPFLIDQLSKL
jgi:hypothetical protein